jgi:hypothetical protein
MVSRVRRSGFRGWASRQERAPGLVALRRFEQPLVGAIHHPVGVVILLAIQWYALTRALLGFPASCNGRLYRPGARAGKMAPSENLKRSARPPWNVSHETASTLGDGSGWDSRQ